MFMGLNLNQILKFFIKHFRGSGDDAESPGLSIGGQTSQIWVDLAVFWYVFGAGSFVNCVAGGFRGGCLGGFPALVGLGFGDILDFSVNIFRGSGDDAELPGLSIGGQTSQIGVDLAVFWSFSGAGSFVICVAGGFRGGRLGGFPAFLGPDLVKFAVFS